MNPLDFVRSHIDYQTSAEIPTITKKISFVLRSDGLWEIHSNPVATFYVHRFSAKIPGFTADTYQQGFVLNLPKIPRAILDQAASFFRYLASRYDLEAYIQIFWNPQTQMYYISCPKQIATKTRVVYDQDPSIPLDHLLVCEMHSHNTMKSFFSPKDDEDELTRGDRFFGVMGEIKGNEFKLTLSFISGGIRILIDPFDLFDQHSFPDNWLSKLEFETIQEQQSFYLEGEDDPDDDSSDS